MARTTDLINALERLGRAGGADLARVMGVSAPTLSRAVRAAGDVVCRMGRRRGAQYALRRRIADLPVRLPVFRVDQEGRPARVGDISPLRDGAHWFECSDGSGILYEGTPPFVADMQPQGYLGAGFARRHPALGLPERLSDWNDDHRLIALARRGEDGIGNLLLGETAFERFWALRQSGVEPVPDARYPELAGSALDTPVGSSAGGEHPKFAAFSATAEAHVLVKFPPETTEVAATRWRDLLVCEELALETLRDHAIAVPATRLLDVGQQRFLETVRFDRVGSFGRLGVVSMAAVDAEYVGLGRDWSRVAESMHRDGWLDRDDVQRVRFVDVFGRLIGNTDRHLGNITFFCDGPTRRGDLLQLAPVYDMLPMVFAPSGGRLPSASFDPGAPRAADIEVWPRALDAAIAYWGRVIEDTRITPAFQTLAGEALDRLRRPGV